MGLFSDFVSGTFGSVAGAISNTVGSVMNYNLGKKQLSYQKSVDERNFANQDRSFNYQKYLNNNQIQIQAADAQKAGINPMAMNSTSLNSANYSNVSSNTQAPQIDLSGLLQAGTAIDRNRLDKKMNDANNETSRANTDSVNKSNEKMNQDRLDSEVKLETMKENASLQQQIIAISHDTEMKKADRESSIARLEKQIESNEKIANARLSEDQYQFDVDNERKQRELINASKSTAIDNLTKAYQQYCNQNGIPYGSSSSGGVVGTVYNALKDGAKGIQNLSGMYKKFWQWYVDSDFRIDTEYHSSVRRR